MTDDTDTILRSLRHMAWERAKGEMRAALETYWSTWTVTGQKLPNGFEETASRVEAFIKEVEDNGLFD